MVEAGFGRLVGTEVDTRVMETERLLDDPAEYRARVAGKNPFGMEGRGSELPGFGGE